MLQQSKLHFVVAFDIKEFFDKVNHQKLLHKMYAMGIRDITLKSNIKRILKAPVKMPSVSCCIQGKERRKAELSLLSLQILY